LELVYARNVKVQQQAVTVAEKLYNDNKKQLEIGTMAPLDVTRAESELATDRQKSHRGADRAIAKRADLKERHHEESAGEYRERRDIPTELPSRPEVIEAPSFQQAASEAFAKRPDVQEMAINILNGQIDVSATRNALLPTATLTAQYGSVGLAGNQSTSLGHDRGRAHCRRDRGAYSGEFVPAAQVTPTGTVKGGFGDAMSSVFHNNFRITTCS